MNLTVIFPRLTVLDIKMLKIIFRRLYIMDFPCFIMPSVGAVFRILTEESAFLDFDIRQEDRNVSLSLETVKEEEY